MVRKYNPLRGASPSILGPYLVFLSCACHSLSLSHFAHALRRTAWLPLQMMYRSRQCWAGTVVYWKHRWPWIHRRMDSWHSFAAENARYGQSPIGRFVWLGHHRERWWFLASSGVTRTRSVLEPAPGRLRCPRRCWRGRSCVACSGGSLPFYRSVSL